MAAGTLNPMMDQLRRAVLRVDGAGLTDGQLLESFVTRKDDAAFEALLRRHGPMVLGVCRRVLRNHHDAEDAFQATFLVLVRKAGSIKPREMVANWLYGVACRTARKARTVSVRHTQRERQVTDMPEPEAVEPDKSLLDLQPLLDQELSRLPDKYRVPIVLCDLEGKTGKAAARQLGWPEGTVASRLSRGRALLAKRLTRHGLALSGSSLAVVLSQPTASASVPTSLVSTTIKAASLLAAGQALTTGLVSAKVAALTEGVVRTMLLSKLKIPLMLLAVSGIVGTGLGGMSFRAGATDSPAAQNGKQQVAGADVNPPKEQNRAIDASATKTDQKRIQGTWKMVSVIDNGQQVPAEALTSLGLVITKDRITEKDGDRVLQECAYTIDPAKSPKWIDEIRETKTVRGIYDLNGDDLKICLDESGSRERPAALASKPGSKTVLMTFQRDKPEQKRQKAPDDRKPPDQAKQVLDMVLKGMQAYQESKGGDAGKKTERPDKEALEQYRDAFLRAFRISSEIAKAKGQKGPGDKKPTDEDLAKRLWEMIEKSYKPPDGKKADKEALDQYREAFFKAFQISSEIAKSKARKATDGKKSADEDLGKLLWEMMEKSYKPPDGKKAGSEALDQHREAFLKAFQIASEIAKAKKEIESSMSKLERSADERTELEALEEIERAVKDLKKKIQDRKNRK